MSLHFCLTLIRRHLPSTRVARHLSIAAVLAVTWVAGMPSAEAQIANCVNFEQTFGYKSNEPPKSYHVQYIGSNVAGNVFWPGDEALVEFQISNLTDQPLRATGQWQIIQYATRCQPLDPFAPPLVSKVKDAGSVPAAVDIPAKGFVNQKIKLPLPAEFAPYAVVLSLDGPGRELATICMRTLAATPGKVQFPTYACDLSSDLAPFFARIGVKGTRQELGYFNPDDAAQWARLDASMKLLADHNIALMLTVSTGGDTNKMPLGRIRGLLNDKAEGRMDYPGDFTMLPQYDEDFQKWVRVLLERYGWPKGPVNAIELWNEPWEGISISGWGADMPRYRELYTRMAQGTEEARKNAGVQVLVGGACSSMNTEDKLFADGNDEPFLKWLDFTSIHYQPMCPEPVLIKKYAERKSPNGPTRVWDTESWIGNSEDRVVGMIASMRATGLDRTSGVNHGAVREEGQTSVRQVDGSAKSVPIVQPLAPASAIAAGNAFLGQRAFQEVLFKNGLPWVFVFRGLTGEDDGTVVVIGDLGQVYERDVLLFRGVLGFDARKRGAELRPKLAELPPDATEQQRNTLINALRTAEVLDNASLTFPAADGHFVSLDCYGNPVKPEGGKIVVPLNGLGYFLRTDGSPGSFAKLLAAVKAARIDGYEPVDVVAHDLLARVEAKPGLRLTLTNILNRPLAGKLDVKLGSLTLDAASQQLELEPHETREIELSVTGGASVADNSYPLSVVFDAGADGRKQHEETMHVNVVAHQTINVDGNLDEWKDAPPQPIRSSPGAGRNLTEKAWLPFVKFDDAAGQGYASGFLAYDDKHFYFAAKIADATPYDGTLRFSTRDEDANFYPEAAWDVRTENGKETRQEYKWPGGVRHYSYRKSPDMPAAESSDTVQIGFNVLPLEKTDWLSHPPGTMPRFICSKSTDYEYALNPVAEKHGGGTELWRLMAPGVPRKHYYPRQPKVPAPGKDGGPVADGKLVIKRDGNVRLVECAIPWSELPAVKQKLDAGEPIKFTFRVNDNKGPSYESNQNRSVSKTDTYALHNYWQTSWAVETEFAFEK
jgi:hypothetical protein